MSWDPAQYLKYASERLRPALDLVARVGVARPRSVVDLGCGAGNVTRILAERWPDAAITGVDNSAAMLSQARAAMQNETRVAWMEDDLARWAASAPESAVDLVYSNAALHWLDGHATLFPRLMALVAPGGALAVQMPSNFAAPSHVLLNEIARGPKWRARLGALVRPVPVAPAAQYFAWLEPLAQSVDAWTTEYLHVLPKANGGLHPVIAWMKGTALTPFLAALDPESQPAFVAECEERIAPAYRALRDGRVLYPFRRVFMVATRANR